MYVYIYIYICMYAYDGCRLGFERDHLLCLMSSPHSPMYTYTYIFIHTHTHIYIYVLH